jgi:hypothetical protein
VGGKNRSKRTDRTYLDWEERESRELAGFQFSGKAGEVPSDQSAVISERQEREYGQWIYRASRTQRFGRKLWLMVDG